MRRSRTRTPTVSVSGLTLVEVLVVVALSGLVASVLAGHVAQGTETARRRAFLHEVEQLDARARIDARLGSAIVIENDAERRRLLARESASHEVVAEVELPERTSVDLADAHGHRVHSVRVDRQGTSADYTIDLVSGSQEPRRARIEVSGVTGWAKTAEATR